jgi:hypothetical protein
VIKQDKLDCDQGYDDSAGEKGSPEQLSHHKETSVTKQENDRLMFQGGIETTLQFFNRQVKRSGYDKGGRSE